MTTSENLDLWPIVASAISAVTMIVVGLLSIILRGVLLTVRDLRAGKDKIRDDLAEARELLQGQFLTREEARHERENALARIDRLEARVLVLEQNSRPL